MPEPKPKHSRPMFNCVDCGRLIDGRAARCGHCEGRRRWRIGMYAHLGKSREAGK